MEFLERSAGLAPDDGACLACGQRRPPLFETPVIPYRPWRMSTLAQVEAYCDSLAEEALEWVIVLYVDDECALVSAETVARGTIGEARFSIGALICRGLTLRAAGFILVHNHPSGDPTPSRQDIDLTVRLADISRDCELPLLVHAVVAKGGMRTVGYW